MCECFPRRYSRLPFEVHTHVSPFYSESLLGSARAYVPFHDNVSFTWTDSERSAIGGESCIFLLRPGIYHVEAKKGNEVAVATVQVMRADLPIVARYEVQHASNESSRDGKVVAHVENVSTHSYLWSNGNITILPCLEDASAGNYSVSILDDKFRALPFVHACGPATIEVKKGQ